MRTTLLGLLTATVLASAAFAQTSPFGAPSAPLSAGELKAIKEEGAAAKRARAEAAARAEKKREDARIAKEAKEAAARAEAEAAAAAAAAPSPATEAAAQAAPTPPGATVGSNTTVIQEAVQPVAPAPIAGETVVVPLPQGTSTVPAEAVAPIVIPVDPAAPAVVPAPIDAGVPALPPTEGN